MSNLVTIKTFEVYNYSISSSGTQEAELVSGTVNSMNNPSLPVEKHVPADGFLMSVIGTAGNHCGVRVDSDTGDYFKVPAGTSQLFRIPVKKKVSLYNESSGTVSVSIGFIRGKNHM